MIFLDTNVLSEVMRQSPEPAVLQWLEVHDSDVGLSSVALAEIVYGIERIRPAERAKRLAGTLEQIRLRYQARVFPFDLDCAQIYGELMGQASRSGKPLSMPDGLIAAIAIRHKAGLATRNTADFSFLKLRLFNPWD